MMDGRGFNRSPLFTVAEVRLDDQGLLPTDQTAPVSGWLHELAADADARAAVVRQTLDGAVDSVVRMGAASPPPTATSRRRWICFVPTSTAPTTVPGARSARPPPTAACCAASCSRAGRKFVGAGDLMRSIEVQGRLAA